MIVNQASLKGLDIAYSTAFNQAFAGVKDTHDKFATTVPSSTGETNYTWLGQMPGMREWIGERTIQNISAYDYTIKNKNFESTISIPRNAIETSTDSIQLYLPHMAKRLQDIRIYSAMMY